MTSSDHSRSSRSSSPSASAISSARSISAASRSASGRSLCRACHRRLCPEGADHRPDRAHRPGHVPVWDRHSLRPAILRRHESVRQAASTICWRWSLSPQALLVALGLGHVFGIKIGHTLGIFAGSMTSTATLQAALEVMKNKRAFDRIFDRLSLRRDRTDPVHLLHDALCSRISGQGATISYGRDHARRTRRTGRTSRNSAKICRAASRSRWSARAARMSFRRPNLFWRRRRLCWSSPTSEEAIAEAATRLGKLEPGRIVKDRSDLDYIRVFVGKANWSGCRLRNFRCRPAFRPSSACQAL